MNEQQINFLRGPGRAALAEHDRLVAAIAARRVTDYSPAAAAVLFAEVHYAEDFRWVADTGRWAAWNGVRWEMPADDTLGDGLMKFLGAFAAVAVADPRFGRRAAARGRQIDSWRFQAGTMAKLRRMLTAHIVCPPPGLSRSAVRRRFELSKWIEAQPYAAIAAAGPVLAFERAR